MFGMLLLFSSRYLIISIIISSWIHDTCIYPWHVYPWPSYIYLEVGLSYIPHILEGGDYSNCLLLLIFLHFGKKRYVHKVDFSVFLILYTLICHQFLKNILHKVEKLLFSIGRAQFYVCTLDEVCSWWCSNFLCSTYFSAWPISIWVRIV